MKAEDREAIMELPDDDSPGRTAVVIVSCSRFQQVWKPFFALFRRYWHDCPYPVYFLTDGERAVTWETIVGDSAPLIKVTDHDRGWRNNFLELIRTVQHEHVIVFQEDFLLLSHVDTPVVRRLTRYARESEVGCLRLMPCPGPDRPWKDGFLGEIGRKTKYLVSLQLAIWNRDMLFRIVYGSRDPWDMENRGVEIAKEEKQPFLSVHRESPDDPGGPVPYFITAVTRGRWEKGALELLRREGIPMDGITERIP